MRVHSSRRLGPSAVWGERAGRTRRDTWVVDPACSLYVLVRCPRLALDIQRATCDGAHPSAPVEFANRLELRPQAGGVGVWDPQQKSRNTSATAWRDDRPMNRPLSTHRAGVLSERQRDGLGAAHREENTMKLTERLVEQRRKADEADTEGRRRIEEYNASVRHGEQLPRGARGRATLGVAGPLRQRTATRAPAPWAGVALPGWDAPKSGGRRRPTAGSA